MARIVNLDGTLVPPEQATVSVFDRGFLYGDSVYEVFRTYAGRPFRLDAHLARLRNSAAYIGMAIPWDDARFRAEVEKTLAAVQNPESYVRIVVTRGAGEINLDPAAAVGPRVILIAKELVPPPAAAYEKGIKLALVPQRRNLREAVDPAAKTGNYLNNVLAMRQARALDGFEALMLDHKGRVTEAATANVFLVERGILLTPAFDVGILEGITRRAVIDWGRELGFRVRETDLWPERVLAADEVFITSTTRELVPVVAVLEGSAEHVIGDGTPGPVTLKLLAEFRRRAAAEAR